MLWGEFVGGDMEGTEIQMIAFKDRLEGRIQGLSDVSMEDKLTKLNEMMSSTIVTVKGHKKEHNPESTTILDDIVYNTEWIIGLKRYVSHALQSNLCTMIISIFLSIKIYFIVWLKQSYFNAFLLSYKK